MKLPRYPKYTKYKPSGVDWLGDVPEHWGLEKFSRVVRIVEGQVDPEVEPYASMLLLAPNHIESGTGRLLATETAAEQGAISGKYFCRNGEVVYSKIRPALAKATLAPEDCLCSADMYPMTPAGRLESRFLLALVLSAPFTAWSVLEADRVAMPKINRETLNELRLALPPPVEQAAIVDFLDRETATIDALIEKQQALVERLKEKRAALISRTVTRGLPTDAATAVGSDTSPKLKSSGLDWLGDVPDHWVVHRIATESTKITNGYVGPTRDILVNDGVRYLQSLHIKNNRIVFERPFFVEAQWSGEHAKSILRPDDVLIVQTGDIGQVAVVTEEFAGSNCHALIIISPHRGRLSGAFLAQFLNSTFGFHELKQIETGALHPHLNCGLVRDVRFPVPPLPEQLAIVEYLSMETDKIDALIDKTESAIERLREVRTSLITSAVTGKVDVRGVVETT